MLEGPSVRRKIWMRKEMRQSRRSSAASRSAPARGRFPVVRRHLEQGVDIRLIFEGDRAVHRDDRFIGEALIGRLLFLVAVGTVIEHLLHLPQVVRCRDHVEEEAAGAQHPSELLQGQGGKAVEQHVHRLVCQRQMIGGRHGELHRLLPLCRIAQDRFGNVDACHFWRFSGIAEGAIQPGGIVALTASGVQDHRRIPTTGEDLKTDSIQQRGIIPFG